MFDQLAFYYYIGTDLFKVWERTRSELYGGGAGAVAAKLHVPGTVLKYYSM